jgi:hypothetical protein
MSTQTLRSLVNHGCAGLASVDGQQITYTCLPPGWPR